jgi:hypothetical protein
MSSPSFEWSEYQVHNSGAIARAFLQLQHRAIREGRGTEMLSAAREIYEHLRRHPNEFGEPLYRLPNLCMSVRNGVIRPLYIDYAVCEDRPLVFIKAVRLLSRGTN